MVRLSSEREPALPYTALQVGLHWLVVAMIVSQYFTSGAIHRTHNPLVPPAEIDLVLHAMHNYGGMAIGLAMGLRLLLRLWRPVPVAAERPWQSRLASATHRALYAAIFAQAATGFVASYFWGGAGRFHVFTWNVILALTALHIAGAVWHVAAGERLRMFRFSTSR
ncbi:MAG: cytochrome b/b6 domain-containing protein [Rhizobiaceae bacterium]|nr:cytochrome b/b6 domain-containing protein [Rhizobiaceae bacterium]